MTRPIRKRMENWISGRELPTDTCIIKPNLWIIIIVITSKRARIPRATAVAMNNLLKIITLLLLLSPWVISSRYRNAGV